MRTPIPGTQCETGPLEGWHAARVADMAWQGSDRKAPPGSFPAASPLPSWTNEVTRAIADGEIALGLFVTGQVEPCGAVIARRKPDTGDDFELLFAGSSFDPDGTLAALIDAGRRAADEKGARLVNRVEIPARTEFTEV